MLRITRKSGQSINLYDKETGKLLFTVSVENIKHGQVSIGITNDPSKTFVLRKEKEHHADQN